MSPHGCVVLVPFASFIEPACETQLQELERRGYVVRRVPATAAIDFSRSQIASEALADGFDELLWIDADILFSPDDVDRLRSHGAPLVAGLFAKRGQPEFIASFLPDTDEVRFGEGGGLLEVRYAGTGFFLTRRALYDDIRRAYSLPRCNSRFGLAVVPYFLPMVIPDEGGGHWYLSEDYAFCERARQAGHKVLVDTSVRLWHIGKYPYGWEDVGAPRERHGSMTFRKR